MKNYWNKYYKLKKTPLASSSFAKYCWKNYLKKNKSLLEIGCGNGRDSFFFYKKGMRVTAIDKSNPIIKKNIQRNRKINFIDMDITSKKLYSIGKFDYIYARFFLHAINSKSQNNLFKNIKKLCSNKKSIMMFEFRTIKDPLFLKGKKISKYERLTDHYRRFIDKDILCKYLAKRKFTFINIIEKKGLAKYKKDNPVLCRLVIKKIK